MYEQYILKRPSNKNLNFKDIITLETKNLSIQIREKSQNKKQTVRKTLPALKN